MTSILFRKLAETEPTSFFESTAPQLTDYFRSRLRHDIKTRQAQAYGLFVESELVGIVTISNASVERRNLPNRTMRAAGLNRGAYPVLPATLIGRLAVAAQHTGRGYGKVLLASTLTLIREAAEISGSAVAVVDPLDDIAAQFYAKAGFAPVAADDTGRMFLLVEEITLPPVAET